MTLVSITPQEKGPRFVDGVWQAVPLVALLARVEWYEDSAVKREW